MRVLVMAMLALALAAAAIAAPASRRAAVTPPRAADAADDSAAVSRAIGLANAAYLDGFKRGDAAAVAAVYDEDAAELHPGGEMVRGRAAIAAKLAPLLGRIHFINGSITSDSRWRVDDVVYDVGHYTFVFQPAGQDTLIEKSRYLYLWRQQKDGTWRIWRDVPVPHE